MLFSWVDKKTDKTTEGYRGFIMNFTMTEGTNYLLEADISKMTKGQFLKDSNYEKNAQTILVPVMCSEKKIPYRYEKPEDMKGKGITDLQSRR